MEHKRKKDFDFESADDVNDRRPKRLKPILEEDERFVITVTDR